MNEDRSRIIGESSGRLIQQFGMGLMM